MINFSQTCEILKNDPKNWLITGVAGFIGSNILELLLKLEQNVIGIDNFSTGKLSNLNQLEKTMEPNLWKNFTFIEGDIRDYELCKRGCKEVEIVLHQAALGSVPRSIKNPLMTNDVNISGFLNVLESAKNEGVKSFIYAASSSTYGDHPDLPKVENIIGNPLSPYAVTKYVNEIYADVYKRTYDFDSIGLRYFNVFGKKQSPEGDYAAVIPKWVNCIINNQEIFIYGDGQTSRDFCYVENVIQANILAAMTQAEEAKNQIYNIAMNDSTTLNELFELISDELRNNGFIYKLKPKYLDFRKGDVRHSRANINKASNLLGYSPMFDVRKGIEHSLPWYIENVS
tara:strand:+ start:34318 stop:35343 length:1026 start_codon:yes stop_codon:yes gene_type:complete